MLLAHLHESDDLPLLARVILGRLKAGDKIRVKVSMPSEREDWWGPLQNVRLGTPMKMNPGNPISVPRLFIHWRQGGEIGHSTSQWVRADTFDDRFQLVKDEHGVSDWVLKFRPKQVGEALDEHEPLLVTVIERKLDQDVKVLIDIETPKSKNGVTFKHIGTVTSIGTLEMRSPQMVQLAGGERGVQITYEKSSAAPGYKGYTDLILPIAGFDELYTAQPMKSFGPDALLLTNVKLAESEHDDSDTLFIIMLKKVLANNERVAMDTKLSSRYEGDVYTSSKRMSELRELRFLGGHPVFAMSSPSRSSYSMDHSFRVPMGDTESWNLEKKHAKSGDFWFISDGVEF